MLVLVNLMHKKHEKVDHNSMGVKHALHDQMKIASKLEQHKVRQNNE